MSSKDNYSISSGTGKSLTAGGTDHKRNVGIVSAFFCVVSRCVGTGIFSTPGTIFTNCGSPGLALIMWAIGTLISFAGLMCYLEFGSMCPSNGGESVYITKAYPRPKLFAAATYCIYVFLLGWASSNSVAFGQYILAAAGYWDSDRTAWQEQWVQPLVGFACLTFAFIMQAFFPRPALYLSNILGIIKVVIIALIIVIGWVALGGGGGIAPTHNFRSSFDKGTEYTGYGVINSLLSVIWSFIGYSNANYALGEARNPHRVLKIAAPAAFITVSILYMLANVSYLGVVPWRAAEGSPSITTSSNILAADFFQIIWGDAGRTAISVFVALSALGNVLVVIYGQGRLIQQLAREGVMPLSRILGSNRPFGTPFAALFEHYCLSLVILFAPAAAGTAARSDSYNFVSNLMTYPLSVVNGFVAIGIMWINYRKRDRVLKFGKYRKELPALYPDWKPAIKATWPVALFFLLGNLYLIVVAFIPPPKGESGQYATMPYWIHACVGLCLYGAGIIYWLVVFQIWPWIRKYRVETRTYIDDDGWERTEIVHRKDSGEIVDETNKLYEWLEPIIRPLNRAQKWVGWIDEKTRIPEFKVRNKRLTLEMTKDVKVDSV